MLTEQFIINMAIATAINDWIHEIGYVIDKDSNLLDRIFEIEDVVNKATKKAKEKIAKYKGTV